MTPVIDGQIHHFEHGGLYDGLFLLRDRETGSHWNHITGECLEGPLLGTVLPTEMLLHITAGKAAERFPGLLYAQPDINWRQRVVAWLQARFIKADGRSFIPPFFRRTMGQKDDRLPELAIGLGVWSQMTQRFYPRDVIEAAGNALLDELDGRPIVVYKDPGNYSLAAVYTNASQIAWEGTDLWLNDIGYIRDGRLHTEGQENLWPEQPSQIYSRWYGFSYTFPGCEIVSTGRSDFACQ